MKTAARKKIPSALKWHGGKAYLAETIIAMMPPRCRNPNNPDDDDPGWLHFVETHYGSGKVMFAMDPNGISLIANDINGRLTNFWDVLKSRELFPEFCRCVELTACSAMEFKRSKARLHDKDPVSAAVAFFVVNRQSRQALGKSFSTISRNRTRRGMNELASAWLSSIDGLPEVHQFLQRVIILNDDATKVIKQQDGPRSFFYLDPTYLPETRAVPKAYEFEMTEKQHVDLLKTLTSIKGRFLLSGYESDMYHDFAQTHKWSCDSIEIDNKASSKKTKEKKRECIWCNFPPLIQP